MSSNQEAPSVEETLNKTDLGQVINDNKKPILIIGAIVLALILAYSIMVQVNKSRNFETLDKVFKIEQSLFTPYLESKEKPDVFIGKLLKMENEFHAHASLTPAFLSSLNKLIEDKGMTKEVVDFSKTWINKMDQKGNLFVLSGIRVAAILEDRDRASESIEILEGMIGNKIEFLSDKIHFELGRMLVAQGKKDEAKEHLQIVVDAETPSEFKTMAKIYLNE